MKSICVVRHCKAEGQEADAPLTSEGVAQAHRLADLLATMNIERIICSPYLRATQTIMPLARRLNLTVENDVRLVERVLCPTPLPDWKDRLRDSFSNLDLTLEGGESGRAAMQRAVAVITDVQSHRAQNTLLVTHGNLMTLLLKHFDETIGFDEWSALTNPDAFRVLLNKPVSINREVVGVVTQGNVTAA